VGTMGRGQLPPPNEPQNDRPPPNFPRPAEQFAPLGRRTEEESEKYLRPYLTFLDVANKEPSLASCLRLENVPPNAFVEKLASLLGVELIDPPHNIARLSSGDLYINLASEDLATKAATQNGSEIDNTRIKITQITRAAMAEAIKDHLSQLDNKCVIMVSAVNGITREEILQLLVQVDVSPENITKQIDDKQTTYEISFRSAKEAALAMDVLSRDMPVKVSDGRTKS
jgi:hypothetical protein